MNRSFMDKTFTNKLFDKLRNFHGNPVYAKETKLRVRSVKFALTVLFFNLILIVIALFAFETMFNVQWNQYIDYADAARLYMGLIVLETCMVMFLVPAFTAGSIAGEREKQTLDILLTTTLKPRQIVWGKLASSISMILLLIVSSLPVVSIVFTIGGIGLTDLLHFVVMIFVFSILLGSIGIWGSVMIKKTVPATVFTYGGILLLCAGTVIVVGAVGVITHLYTYNVYQGTRANPDISLWLLLLLFNPACTLLEMIFDQYSGYSFLSVMNEELGGSVPDFLTDHWGVISLLLQLVLAVLIMMLAEKQLNPLRKKRAKRRKNRKG